MKKYLITLMVLFTIVGTLTFASSVVEDVYHSTFPITVNNQKYVSEMPILNYQGRTYLPLREFGNTTGVNVDFKDNTILIDTYKKDDMFVANTTTYYVLSNLSSINENNEHLISLYYDFLDGSQYALATAQSVFILNTTYANNINNNQYIEKLKDIIKLYLTGDDYQKYSSLLNKIESYLESSKQYNQLVLDAINKKYTAKQVNASWGSIVSEYNEILPELNDLTYLFFNLYW